MNNPREMKFFSAGRSFVNNLSLYDQKNIEGKLNGVILDFIKKYAQTNFEDLLKLVSINEQVQKYCYLNHEEYKKFWNEFLSNPIILEKLNKHRISLKPQQNIHSLDLIRATYCLMSAYEEYNKEKELKINGNQSKFFQLLQRAVSHGSYQAGCLMLELYRKNKIDCSFNELGKQLYPLIQKHKTPGYVLLAKFYITNMKYQAALVCLEAAQNFIADSTVEMHNAQINPEQMQTMISTLINSCQKHLDEQIIKEIIEIAGNEDQTDTYLSSIFDEAMPKVLSSP